MSEPKQWVGAKENCWQPMGETTAALPPGFYEFTAVMGGFLAHKDPKTDKAIIVADSVSNRIIEQIKIFQSKRADYARFGLLHKRGILLEGPAGSGKTMSANIAGQYVVGIGGAVIAPSSPNHFGYFPSFLDRIRKVHPNLPLMCILEDIDAEGYVGEIEKHLALLDGKNQIGNCFYVATTNHIDQVDERLTNRPKRYDEVIHVGPPSEAARRSYLEQLVPADQAMRKEAIDVMSKMSDGFMLAHLSELMIAYLLLDHPLEEAVKRLRTMNMVPANDDAMIGGPQGGGVFTIQLDAASVKAATKRRR